MVASNTNRALRQVPGLDAFVINYFRVISYLRAVEKLSKHLFRSKYNRSAEFFFGRWWYLFLLLENVSII